MKTIETSKLEGIALDYAVAKCINRVNMHFVTQWETSHQNYSTDWSEGGPIIERGRIELHYYTTNGLWGASTPSDARLYFGNTQLSAAMRCFVASRLGDAVDIPQEVQP